MVMVMVILSVGRENHLIQTISFQGSAGFDIWRSRFDYAIAPLSTAPLLNQRGIFYQNP
jgi:hypothetical protein